MSLVTALSCATREPPPPWEPPPRLQEQATPTPTPPASGEPPRVSGFPPFVLGDGVSVTHPDRAEVGRPLPITATTITAGVAKVVVRYKPFGAVKWKTLTLAATDGVFTGEIPCDAVRVIGDLKYFVVASDESGAPLATAGSVKEPLRTAVTNSKDETLWRLPGKEPPAKCSPAPELEPPPRMG